MWNEQKNSYFIFIRKTKLITYRSSSKWSIDARKLALSDITSPQRFCTTFNWFSNFSISLRTLCIWSVYICSVDWPSFWDFISFSSFKNEVIFCFEFFLLGNEKKNFIFNEFMGRKQCFERENSASSKIVFYV